MEMKQQEEKFSFISFRYYHFLTQSLKMMIIRRNYIVELISDCPNISY
jgi:hypothetical protein